MSEVKPHYKHLVKKSDCGDSYYIFSTRQGNLKFCPFCGKPVKKEPKRRKKHE